MSSALRVLLVGDIMLDLYWQGDVDRISPEAPVPVLAVQGRECRPGGAANVAANLVALGSPVTLLSAVGEDEGGRLLRAMMDNIGVPFEAVSEPRYLTTQKIRCVSRRQQLLRADFETDLPETLRNALTERFHSLVSSHDLIVLSDYAKGCLTDCATLVSTARALGKPVLVDPKGHDYRRYEGATLVKPNMAEFVNYVGRITDDAHFCQQGDRLRRHLRLEHLLVTRGERGMSLFNEDGVFHHVAQAREVYDVCGAGDTVLATLAHMMAMGCSLPEAMRWANAAAGIVVGRFGAAQVTFEELQEKMGGDASAHAFTQPLPTYLNE
jgi:rfaE bifunctional protein kinase chain/domain